MGYIYKITNQINGKSYIGKTERTIEIRWKEHLRHIPMLSDKLPLYKAMKKYGKENFSIEQIEECDNSILDEREIYWIDKFHTYGKGYNCTGGSEGGTKPFDTQELQQIIDRYRNGERLDKLCKEFHHDYERIRDELIKAGVQVNIYAGPMKIAKLVAAIDMKSGEIVKIYESISAAARALCPIGNNPRAVGNHISKVKDIKGRYAHGFYWKTELTLPNIKELYMRQQGN